MTEELLFKNNVCVPLAEVDKVNPNCHDITRGICPLNWQVRHDFFNNLPFKWELETGILKNCRCTVLTWCFPLFKLPL
jgi:hypothetical protein